MQNASFDRFDLCDKILNRQPLQSNQRKNGVIDDVLVIGIGPFNHRGFTHVVFDLFDPRDFHQNHVGKSTNAHVAPNFAIICVFQQHQIPRFLSPQIVDPRNFLNVCRVFLDLNVV